MKAIKFTLLLVLLSIQFGQAQSLKAWLKAADTSYVQGDYYAAYKYYETALEYDTANVDVWYKLGKSASAFNAYAYAERAFLKTEKLDKDTLYKDIHCELGEVRQKMGKFNEAIRNFDKCIAQNGLPANVIEDAREKKQDCQWAISEALRSAVQGDVKNLGDELNSPYSDFGAVYKGDALYYSSWQFEDKEDKNKPKRTFIRVMKSEDHVNGELLQDTAMNKPLKHTAYTSFSQDQQRMYYCECEYITVAEVRCDILFRNQLSDGSWSAATTLSANLPEYTTTQPAVGFNETTGEEVLFFSSNRPGGKGKLDLWFGQVDETGDVKEVRNLTALNTVKNDGTPFWHNRSQRLYFSSNGRQAIGGYDIYKAYADGDGFTVPENVGIPINSSFDDLHFALNETGDKAVFSSNRWGATLLEAEQEVCCFDIYEIDLDNSLDLLVTTYDKLDSTELSGVTVKLWDVLPSEEELLKDEQTNELGNDFVFPLERYRKYRVTGEKLDYEGDELVLDLSDLPESQKQVTAELYLEPMRINLMALTVNAYDGSAVNGASVELYKIVDGDTILITKDWHPNDNEYAYQIELNTEYYIRASKDPDYKPIDGTFLFTREDIEEMGRDITIELPLEPRFSYFLPLALYFDNASPDRRSYLATTDKNFENLTADYLAKKDEFVTKYTAGLTGQDSFLVNQLTNQFFDREVSGGMRDLEAFTGKVLEYLEEGNSLNIRLKGYCSPRAGSEYNKQLSKRRIDAIRNYFEEYEVEGEKAFAPYFKSKAFVIEETAFGEDRVGQDLTEEKARYLEADKSSKDDLENINNERTSIYSLRASLERRVEIIDVNAQGSN